MTDCAFKKKITVKKEEDNSPGNDYDWHT
jgi:hypothetical protein